ncbi:MAG: carboxypeptidase-like regulatory domain-containing protein [Planctomycetota bacterium]
MSNRTVGLMLVAAALLTITVAIALLESVSNTTRPPGSSAADTNVLAPPASNRVSPAASALDGTSSTAKESDTTTLTREALAAPSPEGPLEQGQVRFRGRVVDEARLPVSGALVTLTFPGLDQAAALTDGAGRFDLLAGPRQPVEVLKGSLVARHLGGRVAVRQSYLHSQRIMWRAPSDVERDTIDAGVLVLHPASQVRVQVAASSGFVSGVTVRAEWGEDRLLVGEQTTDASGSTTFEAPSGDLALIAIAQGQRGRANVKVPLPSTDQVQIVLEPTWDVLVRVRDGETSAPIAGAMITLLEETRDYFDHEPLGGSGTGLSARRLPLDLPLTDAIGELRVGQFGRDQKIVVRAERKGLKSLANGARGTHYPTDYVQAQTSVDSPVVTLELYMVPRSLTDREWQVDHSECGRAPADAAVHLIAVNPEIPIAGSETARLEGSRLLGTGLDPHIGYVAVAPDGCLAMLRATMRDVLLFRVPRRLSVTVRRADGAPAAGVLVSVRKGYSDLARPLRTDASGRVTFEALYPNFAQVSARRSGYRETLAGTVDLERGDASLTCDLPRERELLVRVTIDEKPRLPAEYELALSDGSLSRLIRAELIQERPQQGELLLPVDEPSAGNPLHLQLLAPGFAPQNATVELGPDDPAVVKFELQRRGILRLRVHPPADGQMRLALLIQRDGELRPLTRTLDNSEERVSRSADGVIEVRDLVPGVYQVSDELSGCKGEKATLTADATVELGLDLSQSVWARGRVQVPDGYPQSGITVLVRPQGVRSAGALAGWGWAGVTGEDGGFLVRIDATAEAVLRPWHPLLQLATEGGTATLPAQGEIVLRMVGGNTLRFRALAPVDRASRLLSLELSLFAGEMGGEPVFRTTCRTAENHIMTCGGFEPGTYTAWLDPGWLAPLKLEGLDLHQGENDLGDLHFTDGTRIHVVPRPRAGQAVPPLAIQARALAKPVYHRRAEMRDRQELVLGGLAAGTFAITVRHAPYGAVLLQRRLEVDGRNEVTLEVEVP